MFWSPLLQNYCAVLYREVLIMDLKNQRISLWLGSSLKFSSFWFLIIIFGFSRKKFWHTCSSLCENNDDIVCLVKPISSNDHYISNPLPYLVCSCWFRHRTSSWFFFGRKKAYHIDLSNLQVTLRDFSMYFSWSISLLLISSGTLYKDWIAQGLCLILPRL